MGGSACCAGNWGGGGGGGGASDDDDEVAMDNDTLTWVVTNPGTVPLKDLKFPARGKIQAHLMYAAAIVGTPDQRGPAVWIWHIHALLYEDEEAPVQSGAGGGGGGVTQVFMLGPIPRQIAR